MTQRGPRLPDEKGYWYPDWRAQWEESLEPTTRKRIARTVGVVERSPIPSRPGLL